LLPVHRFVTDSAEGEYCLHILVAESVPNGQEGRETSDQKADIIASTCRCGW
jgi:hypothetical protein